MKNEHGLLGYVLPGLPNADGSNGTSINSVHTSEIGVAKMGCSNFSHYIDTEFFCPADAISLPLVHVHHVLPVRSQDQMCRIATCPVITRMPNNTIIGIALFDRAVEEFIRKNMGQPLLSIEPERSISCVHKARGVVPTFIRPPFGYFGHKSLDRVNFLWRRLCLACTFVGTEFRFLGVVPSHHYGFATV